MIVSLDNGMRFIANFRYNVKEIVTRDPLKPTSNEIENRFNNELDINGNTNFDADCTKTMPGFV